MWVVKNYSKRMTFSVRIAQTLSARSAWRHPGVSTTVPEHNHSMSPLTMAARLADVSEKSRNDKQMFSNNSIHVLRIKQVLLSSRYETEQWNLQVSLSQNSSNTQSHKSKRLLLWPAHSPRHERITIELLKLHSRRTADFRSTLILHSPICNNFCRAEADV